MNTICIMCPMGCPLSITESGGNITVTGNTCPRGKAYGAQEFTAPMRTVTTLIKMNGGGVASVKTSAPVPKENMFDVLDFIRTLEVPSDCKIGDVASYNVLGLGADLVITGKP